MSRPPEYQVGGKWFPMFEPEGEHPLLKAQRIAHLRAAKEREDAEFRCPTCGELGAMKPPNDRYHPDVCPARRHSDVSSERDGTA